MLRNDVQQALRRGATWAEFTGAHWLAEQMIMAMAKVETEEDVEQYPHDVKRENVVLEVEPVVLPVQPCSA